MSKYIFICVCLAAACTANFTSAQSRALSVKTVVIAVKGSVTFDDITLRKGDTVTLSTGDTNSLKFTHPTDWIKLMNPSTKKVFTLYRQKQFSCYNCLGTRGKKQFPRPPSDLRSYFDRGTIFLFETDTIILKTVTSLSKPEPIPLFEVTFSGKVYGREAGSHDTILVSREHLYGFIHGEMENVHPFKSLAADSVRLVYLDPETKAFTGTSFPYARVLFFVDMVPFLQRMDLTEEGIFRELTDSFVDLSEISRVNSFADDHEAALWLREKIRSAMVLTDQP